ncbi:MAG TPA: hypothetical protein VMI54_22000 [Polyangiaceae bacterium]|nr:hypothetical protein [Polyangiaceae bacterium]
MQGLSVRARERVVVAGALSLATFVSRPALADDGGEDTSRLDLSRSVASTPAAPLGTYVHLFGELSLGKGVHTNNPFRLGTSDALGFTATYLDLSAGVVFGPPDSLQHGLQLSLLAATEGVGQQVFGAYYAALLPLGEHALLRGRAGVPIVITPDASMGLEAGAGGAWLFTGGIGASAELVGSLFYGAASPDRTKTAIPIIALQIGAWFDHEVLP